MHKQLFATGFHIYRLRPSGRAGLTPQLSIFRMFLIVLKITFLPSQARLSISATARRISTNDVTFQDLTLWTKFHPKIAPEGLDPSL
ncbi:MAG: hypothetical protein HRT62_11640 [Epibacterium sp.]|nr:hypothetical protein [Epibacterium sp.]